MPLIYELYSDDLSDNDMIEELERRGYRVLNIGEAKNYTATGFDPESLIVHLEQQRCPEAILEPLRRWLADPSLYRLELAMAVIQ